MTQPAPCPGCGRIQDTRGVHAIACKTASGAIDKHNSIVKGFADELKKGHVNCVMEAFNPASDNRQRPGDIFIPEFDVYGDDFLDVSVINILAPTHITRAPKGPLEGSKIRFVEKKTKYADLGERMKLLVVENTGGWHPYSIDYLKKMAEDIAARSLKTTTEALNVLLTVASVKLQSHQGLTFHRK